jgi:hypothetical protein
VGSKKRTNGTRPVALGDTADELTPEGIAEHVTDGSCDGATLSLLATVRDVLEQAGPAERLEVADWLEAVLRRRRA